MNILFSNHSNFIKITIYTTFVIKKDAIIMDIKSYLIIRELSSINTNKRI